MANGHFATVGDNGDSASYEHGVQVIDENKEFKYGSPPAGPVVPTSGLQAIWYSFTHS
jgi:hypothetical protein